MKTGDKVILHMFTGVAIAVKEIVADSKDTVTIKDKKGNDLVFDKQSLKQISPAPKNPKFANYIIDDDGSFVPKKDKKKAEPKKKKWDEDDFDDDDYIEI